MCTMSKKCRSVCTRRGLFFKSLLITGLASFYNPAWSDQLTSAEIQDISGQQQVIVVLHRSSISSQNSANVEDVIQQYANPARDIVRHRFENVLSGFSGILSDDAVLALKADSRVDFIEADSGVNVLQADEDYYVQSGPSWNLDRIDQTNNSLDGAYHYRNDGTGVNAYIVDSGIRSTHSEFGGRVVGGVSLVPGESSWEDCAGHGTRVAGVLGSETYGVAKNVTLHSVRVFDCDGGTTVSTTIAAMDWIAANHRKPAIANMSFSGEVTDARTRALENLINSGVSVFTGAGNDPEDICNTAPASYQPVITVAATNESDQKRTSSGFGPCVDLFAPGNRISTIGHDSDSATYQANGSSFAAPHVAGVAALFLQENPGASTDNVADFLISNAVGNVVQDAGEGSPNRFVYSRFESTVENSGGDRLVQMIKRNASEFAIDGNNGGGNKQNIYIWGENAGNVNQQWVEIDRGNGYYSYQKQNTGFCIDGGNGGAIGNNVYLYDCRDDNENQHWRKVGVGGGSFRLEKRNSPGFSLDGGRAGGNGQNVYLWASDSDNQNQHWTFDYLD